jgi:hypothetical protein
MILSLSHHFCSHIAAKYPTVFAVITTFVKYVRTVLHQTGHFARYNSTKLRCRYVRYRSKCTIQNDKFVWSRYSQDFLSRKGPISWHTPSNLFGLYFFVNIYYGTYERYATVPLLPRYQHYRTPVSVVYQRYRTPRTAVLVSLRTLVPQDIARLSLHVGSFREAIPNLGTTSP